MKKIVMFDTSYGTMNMGDYIINNSINKEMYEILNKNYVVRFSTHNPLLKTYQNFRKNYISEYCRKADLKFICGSNIFSKDILHMTPNFNINYFDIKNYKNSIAIGCGLGDTNRKGNLYTNNLYKKILSKDFIHSVRDENTKKYLTSLGLKAINTGCATLWGLTSDHCKKIKCTKSENVIFTLTDYDKNVEYDQKLIDILQRKYKKVYFWVQGREDLEYFETFKNIEKIEIVYPNLESFADVLQNCNVDYIGTRLHAGIFAMQNYVRSIILIVDNRARDMKETYNLVAIERENISNLEEMIDSKFKTDVKINEENIKLWKGQFYKNEKE